MPHNIIIIEYTKPGTPVYDEYGRKYFSTVEMHGVRMHEIFPTLGDNLWKSKEKGARSAPLGWQNTHPL